jgi:hypothetical protein
MIPVHKSILAMFLDKVDSDEVLDIAKLFADVRVKDMTIVLRNDYNLAPFLDVLEIWMNMSSVAFSKNIVDSSFKYVISHEVGAKWSAFLSLLLQSVFEKMGVKEVYFEVTDGTILFTVPKSIIRPSG